MKPQKRGRGRPKGSSRHNGPDKIILEQVADMMVRDHRLAATTAMRRLGKEDEASLRRLQRKWARKKHHLLQNAQAEYDRARAISAQERMTDQLAGIAKQMEPAQQASRALFRQLAPTHKAALKLFESNAFSAHINNLDRLKCLVEPSAEMQRLAKTLERFAMPNPAMKKLTQTLNEHAERMQKFSRMLQGPNLSLSIGNKFRPFD